MKALSYNIWASENLDSLRTPRTNALCVGVHGVTGGPHSRCSQQAHSGEPGLPAIESELEGSRGVHENRYLRIHLQPRQTLGGLEHKLSAIWEFVNVAVNIRVATSGTTRTAWKGLDVALERDQPFLHYPLRLQGRGNGWPHSYLALTAIVACQRGSRARSGGFLPLGRGQQ